MKQTEIFDQAASEFGRPFTREEILEKLHEEDRQWEKDTYLNNCIRDRAKKGMLKKLENNLFEYKGKPNPEKGQKKKDKFSEEKTGVLLETEKRLLYVFTWTKKQFNTEFQNSYAAFLTEYGINEEILKSNKDKIFDKLLSNSYKAATARNAYDGILEKPEDNEAYQKFREDQDELSEKTKGLIKKEIEAVKSRFCGKSDFNRWHKRVCKAIKEIYEGVKAEDNVTDAWTYGNSQKVLNMAIKYVVLITMQLKKINPKHEFVRIGTPFLNSIDMLHIPVDRYIIKSIQMWNSNTKHEPKIALPPETGWSKWNEEDYDFYFPTLSKGLQGICPLKWETVVFPVAKALKLPDITNRKFRELLAILDEIVQSQ